MTAKTAGREERDFGDWLGKNGVEILARNQRYLPSGRKWEYDLLIAPKVAIEIDGGSYKFAGGRHGTPPDYAKLLYLQGLGWTIIRVHLAMTKEGSPYRDWVLAVIKARLAGEHVPLPPKIPRKVKQAK